MENTTQFNLNAAVQRWREQLSQSPNLRVANLEELEAHLRDAVAALRERGLSDEESLLIGMRRIGGAPALEAEFAKVNGREVWLNRLLWMLVGALLWTVVRSIASQLANGLVLTGLWGAGYWPSQANWILFAVLLGVVHLVLLVLCIAGGAWLWRRNHNWPGDVLPRLLGRSGSVFLLGIAMLALLGGLIATGNATHLLWARWLPVESYGRLQMASSCSQGVVWILEMTALVFTTLLLARRRLHPMTRALPER